MSDNPKVAPCPVCGLAYGAPVHFHVTPEAQPVTPGGRWEAEYSPDVGWNVHRCDDPDELPNSAVDAMFFQLEESARECAARLNALEAEIAGLHEKAEYWERLAQGPITEGTDYDAMQKTS